VLQDFIFILESIQNGSTSQAQFWESIAILIRSSLPPTSNTLPLSQRPEWRKTVAFALLEVYWRQDQSTFLDQLERLRNQEESTQLEASISNHDILAHIMIESLMLTFHQKTAFELYNNLSERGASMPVRLLEGIVRIAVADNYSSQLTRIGNMLLRHEELHQEFLSTMSSTSNTPSATRQRNRPLLMPSKLLDSFIYSACANGLYELARAVFDKGLEAGRKYRISTLTIILNSYSIKGLGFDVVSAAIKEDKEWCRRRSKRRGRGNNDEPNDSATTDDVLHSSDMDIAVATPKVIEKYISAMEQQNIYPTMTTLNVLVKLYLEMDLYKVADAPSWTAAFRRYNPLGLKPDVVTNNTLLSHYEKLGDLAAMKQIYHSMAGDNGRDPSGAGSSRSRSRPRRLQCKEPLEQHPPANGDTFSVDNTACRLNSEQDLLTDSTDKWKDRQQEDHERSLPPRSLRSNRDIYTYNTMLHALLQHAAKTKDIVTIGQCFHDMEQDGISVDTVTFNTNIWYHISRRDLAAAMQVFRSMKGVAVGSDSPSGMGERHIMVSSNPIRSRPSSAATLGKRIGVTNDPYYPSNSDPYPFMEQSDATAMPSKSPPPPDVVTLTSMISGLGQAGQMDDISLIFREMTTKLRIEPNLKTYSALAAGLHRAGDHRRAEMLWDIVLEEVEKRRDGTQNDNDNDRGVGSDKFQFLKENNNDAIDLLDDEKAEDQQQPRQHRDPTKRPL
jgi:pentatricopeptide repeat protein